MFCFLSYTKMTKFDFFWRFESLCLDPHICYFCAAQNTHYFQLKIYTFVGYNTNYIMIYLQIFLKLRNMIFNYFSEKGLLVLMCTKSLSVYSLLFFCFMCYMKLQELKPLFFLLSTLFLLL